MLEETVPDCATVTRCSLMESIIIERVALTCKPLGTFLSCSNHARLNAVAYSLQIYTHDLDTIPRYSREEEESLDIPF